MAEYKITVNLLTEAIFGSGFSIPGSVDLEVVTDDFGLPYMKAKTIKGNLREAVEIVADLVDKSGKYKSAVEDLFGKGEAGLDQWKTLKFSDMRLAKNIRFAIETEFIKGKLTKEEIMGVLTEVRSFTSIDEDGSYKKGSLRKIRVVKPGLIYEIELHSERELTNVELGVLAMGIRYLRHIGTMRTRGKGEVACNLCKKQGERYVDITDNCLESFLKEVKNHV